MSFKLITGFTNTKNVTAVDDAAFQSGVFGAGEWLLQNGTDLLCTVVNSNTIKISPFSIVRNGVHAINDADVTLTLQNGTQGQVRVDSVVAVIAKDNSTGIETATLVVTKGTNGSENAAAITNSDLVKYVRLVNIRINGLTPETPTVVISKAQNISTLNTKCESLDRTISGIGGGLNDAYSQINLLRSRVTSLEDSLARALEDTGWQSILGSGEWGVTANVTATSNGAPLMYRLKNGYVTIKGQIGVRNKVAGTQLHLFTIPSRLRSTNFNGYAYSLNPSGGTTVTRLIDAHTDGRVLLEWTSNMSNGTEITGDITWIGINIIYPV